MAKRKQQDKRTAPVPRRGPAGKISFSEAVTADSCLPETRLNKRLVLGDPIGEGGMGMITAAVDTNLNRVVARKELKAEFAANESLAGRLIEEAQITAQLDHPNIVPVYEIGTDRKNRVFFTMKLIRGKSLKEILEEKTPANRTAADLFEELQVFLKVCDAVAYAHAKGVIHQDLKPDNVMVGEFGEVYLMDWGFAKIKGHDRTVTNEAAARTKKRKALAIEKQDGMISTTIHYMAPEFTTGVEDDVDERTDIFCLGGILYKILTGKPPFHGQSMSEVARRALHTLMPAPEELAVKDIPERLSRIAMKAMAKDPKDRYQSVMEIKGDVERFLQCGWQFERKTFRTGDVIVKEGDEGTEAYIVTTGRCRIYREVGGEEVTVGELGVGYVFGELAVFAGQPRNATVVAADEVSVMVLEKRHFEEDLGMSFWLGVVVKALAERFLDVSAELADLKSR